MESWRPSSFSQHLIEWNTEQAKVCFDHMIFINVMTSISSLFKRVDMPLPSNMSVFGSEDIQDMHEILKE